jgi:hypothetical protein
MTTAIQKDPRPPESVAANLTVRWAYRLKWNPTTNFGYLQVGGTLYRTELVGSTDVCESWHIAKLIEATGELATPYLCCLPVCGSSFAPSCDCPSFKYAKCEPRRCKHLDFLVAGRELLEVHDVDDDAVERCELAARV